MILYTINICYSEIVHGLVVCVFHVLASSIYHGDSLLALVATSLLVFAVFAYRPGDHVHAPPGGAEVTTPAVCPSDARSS